MSTLTQINTGFFNSLRLFPETWASLAVYALGELVKPVTYASHSYKVTTAGTTASVEPTWITTNGSTCSSGTVIFTCYDEKTYQVNAPQSASMPYVTFGHNTDVPINEFGSFAAIEDLTYWVNIFSNKGVADVNELSDEVNLAIGDATLTVSGGTCLKCRREYTGNIIYDETANSFQIPQRYRVWVD